MVTAKPIYSEQGIVLVAEGTSLTNKIIDALQRRGVSLLYIEDKALDDIEIVEDIPVELRIETTNAITEIYKQVFSRDSRHKRVFEGIKVEKLQVK